MKTPNALELAAPLTSPWYARREFFAPLYTTALPFVVLIVALLVFPSALSAFGMVGVLALLTLRWLARGSPFPVLSINPFLLVLLAMLVPGVLFSPAPETAWMVASHALAGIVVLVTIVDRADSGPHLVTAWGILVLAAVVFAFGAPFAAAWGSKTNPLGALGRFDLLPVRPSNVNNIAGALEAGVPLAVGLIAMRSRPWRVIGASALAPLLVMLALLQSRGAWLAVLMGLVIYATLYRRWVLPFLPIVFLGGLWLNLAFGEPVSTQALGADSQNVVTLGDRTEIWAEGVRVLAMSPLTGVGVNGYGTLGAPKIGQGGSVYVLAHSHAHNLFLEVALDSGLVGLVGFLGILFLAVRGAWRVYRRAALGSRHRAAAIALLAAFVVIFTHGMFDTIFWGFKAGIFLWGTLALALALECLSASEQREQHGTTQ